MIKSTTSLIGVYDPLPSHVFHRYYKFLGRGWHAPFELPARFTRGYKHPRLFQSGGPGFWAGLGSLMRSRLIPKERPKSSGWGGTLISLKMHIRAEPQTLRNAQGCETLRNCRVYRSCTSTPAILPLLLLFRVIQFTNEIETQMQRLLVQFDWFLSVPLFHHLSRWRFQSLLFNEAWVLIHSNGAISSLE